MERPQARPTVVAAAMQPQAKRLALLVIAMFALAAAIAVFAFTRNFAPRHAELTPAPVSIASADQASSAWNLVAPSPIAALQQATKNPAPTKAATKSEPDWSAFSLGVTDAQAMVAMPKTGGDSSPAELAVGMSRDERARQIAAAREVESGATPAGYRPLIGALVPAGSGDGICR